MKNLNLHKAVLLAVFLLVSSYTFSNSIEYGYSSNKLGNTLFPGNITISTNVGHAGTVVTIIAIGGGFVAADASNVTLAGTMVPAILVDGNTIVATIPCIIGPSFTGTFIVNGSLPSANFSYIAPTITTSPSTNSYCDGSTVPPLPLSATPIAPTVGNVIYTWVASDPAIAAVIGTGGTPGVTSIPSFPAVNPTPIPVISTITVTPEINSCVGSAIVYTIIINPTPNMNTLGFPSATPICDGTAVTTVPLTSSVAGTLFTWTSSNPAIGTPPAISGSGSSIPGFTAVNNTNATISSIFTVTPTANGCAGPPATYTVSVLPASLGGIATATTSPICSGGSAIITLTGHTGIIQWQSSPTPAGGYTNVSGANSATLIIPSLVTTTSYRAIVTSGTCSSAFSSVATITVDPPSVAGTATPAVSTICSGGNTTITLTGYTPGSIIQWQTDATGPFLDISGATGNILNLTGISSSANYKAKVTSGTCTPADSNIVNIAVDPLSFGGGITGGSTICFGTASGLLTLVGKTGSVVKWQSSVFPFGTWNDIANTATTYSPGPLSVTTQFRAVVQSGVCSQVNSSPATVTVDSLSVGGTATATASTVCSGVSTTITLIGYTGSIQWQTDASGSFQDIPSEIGPTYTTLPLLSTTSYRAVVKSGVCLAINSTVATVTVDPTSVGGSVSGGTTICLTSTSGPLTLTGNTGNVVRWESSIFPFSTWTNITNTATTYSPGPLSQTTQFRAVVQSGVCSQVNSSPTTVTVDQTSVGGTATATTSTICSGGSTTITLAGSTGNIQWQITDASGSFIDIPFENNPTYTTLPLTSTTSYRAVVQSGVCPAINSTVAIVTVDPTSVGGTVTGAATICLGSTSGLLTLSGNTGNVVRWESSVSPFTAWTTIANTATTYSPVGLIQTTKFRAVVQSGVCPLANSSEVTVTVNPLPTAVIAGTSTVCEGTPTAITFNGIIGTPPFTFTYTINSGAPQTILTTGTNKAVSILANTTTAGTFVYDLISVSDSNTPACSQPTITGQSATVTVNPIPVLVITNPLDICQGGNADLTDPQITIGSDLGLTYSYWLNPAATNSHPSPTAATAGTYYIKAIAGGNPCPTIQPVTVTAQPLPTVTVNVTNPILCDDGVAMATVTANPTPAAGPYNYNWTVPAGAIQPAGNVASFTTNIGGDYKVVISTIGLPQCTSLEATNKVTVNPLPMAKLTSSAANVCLGTPSTITLNGTNGTAPYTFIYNDSFGTPTTVTASSDTYTITLPNLATGNFTYDLVSVTDNKGCSQPIIGQTVTITVHPLPTVNAGSDVTVCVGEPITLTGSGSAVSYTWSNGVNDGIPFNPIITATYTVTGTDIWGCTNTDTVLVTVIPQIEGKIKTPNDFKVCKNATLPDIVFVGSGGTGEYVFDYQITSTTTPPINITGTVTSFLGEATLAPAIPTTTASVFTVKLLSVRDSGFCTMGNLIAPKEAYITVLDSDVIPINPGDVNQIVCENTPITNIVFKINGSPTDAYADGLPGNVISTYNKSAGELTISGSPNVAGVFNYNVHTSGSLLGCNTQYPGTITVNATGKLSAVSPAGSDLQSLCINNAITTINYTLQGAATGATVVFTPYTPAGITGTVSGLNVTISGTPTETGIFNYTIDTFSTLNSCTQAQKTGIITVNESVIILASGVKDQIVCINNALTPIDFDINSTPVTIPEAFLILVGTLPTGVSFDNVTGTISGTPTQGGVFPYSILSSTGCGTPIVGTITVNNILPTVLIESGVAKIDACKGSLITLTATGADTYTWFNLDVLGNLVPVEIGNTYSYSPTKAESIFVVGKIIGGCENTSKIDVNLIEAITGTITGVNSVEVCKNNSNPTITFTGSNGTAPYTFTYSINSLINTVISTVGNSAVISVPTTVTGVFDIKLIDVKDAIGSLYCNPSKLVEPTTGKVTVFESSIIPQTPGTIFQTVCETSPIQDIVFNITGGPSNAFVLGLPQGIMQNYSSGLLTISGTSTEAGIFNYTVYTSGSLVPCNTTFTGTITVTPNQTIQLETIGKDNQQICPGASIDPISYELGASVTNVSVVFTPKTPLGISWNKSGSTLIFSGASNDNPGAYTYTITTQGACASTSATGSITIIPTNTLLLTSGNQNEELCINTALNTIQYNGNPGQTLVLNGLLPPGVLFNANPVTGSATITGTPTLFGNYLYSITTNNNCGDKLDGSIIVNNNDFINYLSGGLNQIACIGSPIVPIRYAVPLKIVIANVTISPTLPAGLSYFVTNGQLVIAGTPTTISSVTSYEVSVIKCGTPVKSTFNLEILDTPIITLESNSGSLTQSVCQNGEIIPIKFKLGGAATGIDQTILPGFITSSYDAVTGIYTLTGAPQTAGVFTFDIKTTGVSSCSTTLSVSISNLYAALSINLAPGSGKDNQIICGFNPITTIVYNIVGTITTSDIKVTGLPAGITSSNLATATGITVTISGTSTIAGIFDYALVYKTCTQPVVIGKISISSPISVTGVVKPISCGGSDGSITVTILGGTPFVNSAGTPYYSIIWAGPNGFSQNQTTITGLAAGNYTLNVVDAIGCALPTAVTYTIAPSLPVNVSLTSSTNMSCNGTLGCANFSITGGTGIYPSFLLQYLDPSSQVLKTITPANNNYYNICGLKAGVYYLTATDSNNCKNAPYLFTIYDYSLLSIKSITYDNQLCNNAPGKIKVEVDSADPKLTFYYNSVLVPSVALGNNTYELTINSPTTPSGIVKVNDSQNCSVTTTVTSTILAPDFEFTSFEFENYGTFSVNSSIEFTNLIDLSKVTTDSHIVWDFGDTTPFKAFYYPKDLAANASGESFINVFHSYAIDGFYEVTMTLVNNSGCSQSITKTITIGSGASMVLPTAFSPNNDGINDLFRPSLIGVKEVSMYIYDEWGNLVYEVSSDALSLSPDWGWNGIEKVNKESKNGTYRYYINAKANDNKIIEKEGRFLLIK